jgi:hypothetical protein
MPAGPFQYIIRPIVRFFLRHWVRHEETVRIRQQLRYLALAEIVSRSEPRPTDLTLFELSVFSQNGEDGVLAEILGRVGVAGRRFVEVGASANEANCLLLADAFGWSGLFVDADAHECDGLARRYAGFPGIKVVHALVTTANFNAALLKAQDVPPDFDVLSIDVDGNDYWIWESLVDCSPRVVVIEYNSSVDPSRELVQPYGPDRWDGSSSFYGASLGALRRLARQKGYRLVHVELTGTNAFFVRNDVAARHFAPEGEIASRAANHFLYGLRYKERKTHRRYVDLAADD